MRHGNNPKIRSREILIAMLQHCKVSGAILSLFDSILHFLCASFTGAKFKMRHSKARDFCGNAKSLQLGPKRRNSRKVQIGSASPPVAMAKGNLRCNRSAVWSLVAGELVCCITRVVGR